MSWSADEYNNFWFIDKRSQTNNLKRWFLMGLLLFIFVGICTAVCVKSMYQPIKQYEIQTQYPEVKVDEAKKTSANGYIKGSITNQSETELKGKYIKFTFYTKHDVDIGKEYIEIGTLAPKETKTYEVKFKYPNVEKFIITISDNKE